MKKFKRGIFIIISILLFFMIFVSEVIGYSTNDYSIDIPSYYEKVEDGNFSYLGSDVLYNVNIQIEYLGDTENFKYTQENLEALESDVNNQGFYVNGYYCNFFVIDTDITTFGKSNYKCFYLHSITTISNLSFFADQYFVVSGDYGYLLTVISNDSDYLESSEAKNIVKSFNIKNFKPVDGTMLLLNNVLIAVASTVVLTLIAILIMKFIDSRRKRYDNEPINLDEYNIGNPQIEFYDDNFKSIETNENYQDTNSKKEIKQEDSALYEEQNDYIPSNDSDVKNMHSKMPRTKFILIIVLVVFGIGIVSATILGNPFIALDSLITPIVYLFYPYTCIKSNEQYTNKEAKKIAIINSVVVAILFAIIRSATTGIFSISPVPAIVYGSIAYSLLKENENNITEDK